MPELPAPVQNIGMVAEPVVLWRVLCLTCGYDLMEDGDFSAMGPGPQEAMDYATGDGYEDRCPKCYQPLTEQACEDAAEMVLENAELVEGGGQDGD